MNVMLVQNAGFCFGVERAVNSVYENLDKHKMPIYTYGPIIHNKEVVDDFKRKGVKVIDSIEQLRNITEGVIIIRSHGVPPIVYNTIKENDLISIDMTCPYVKKIHKIVKEHRDNGYNIIIAGSSNHPEVIGINGWCENSAFIVNSIDECRELPSLDKVCIVAQTTYSVLKWAEITRYLDTNNYNDYVQFNTICNSTNDRQNETAKIAQSADAIIIIGDKSSSNTQKLYQICKDNCQNCYYIETIKDLDINEVKQFENIGITAGASTPDWIILEVVDALNKLDVSHYDTTKSIEISEEMDSFEEELKKSLKEVKVGQIVEVEVVGIKEDEIIVSLGYKSDGIISKDEMLEEDFSNIKVGNRFDALVLRDKYDGNLTLSKKQVDAVYAWDKAKRAFENNTVILIKLIKEVKGGIIGDFEGLNVFVPISQLSDKFVSNVEEYLYSTIPAKIIKFEENPRNIVVSSRIVLEESKKAQKENFWHGIHIGKEFIGKIKNITSYGVFVDIGGTDGLLHISEISYLKGDDPSKYFNENDEVHVCVKEFDRGAQKVMLSLKDRPQSPWTKLEGRYNVGDIIEGRIVKLMNYGLFVEIEPNIEGLVHISEISDKHLSKPSEVLTEGEIVKVKILSIDLISRKIGLSIREVSPINSKDETNVEIDETQKSYSENFNFTIFDAIKNKIK